MKNLFGVIAIILILHSCGSNNVTNSSSSTNPTDSTGVATNDSLDDLDTPERAKLYGIYMIKEFENKDIEEFNIVGKRPFILFDEENKAYSTSIGCNQISGKFDTTDSTIVFKAGISTMMACQDSLEYRYLQTLEQINGYKKIDSHLELYVDSDIKIICVSAVK